MQAGVISLLSLGAAPIPASAAPTNDKTSTADGDAHATSPFAQLLREGEQKAGSNDSPAGKDGSGNGKESATQAATNGNAFVAQEMNAMQLSAQQTITADDARKLIGKIDELSAQLNDQGASNSDQETLSQLKQQLQQIVDSGEPKTVAEVMAAVDQDALEVTASLNDSIEGGAEHIDAKLFALSKVSPLMQRVAQMFHAALVKPTSQEAPKQADADADGQDITDVMPDAITQSLQAAMFRADAEQNAADTQTTKQDSNDKETSDTITEIVPLSAQLIALPQWANAMQATPVSKGGNATAAPTEINSIQSASLPTRADLDDAIPPLTLPKQQAQSLPEVSLPGLTEAATASTKTAEKTSTEKLDTLLSSMPSDAANPVLNPSLVGGHTATQTTNAVQPNHMVGLPNIVNHAPVADQVHVAIKQANSEGLQQITIQLDPLDLGRVEVKMHVNSDGQTQISFTADKASTFDSLSRDARILEHSLQEAGIKADTGSMQFNLRQQPQPQLQSDLGQGQGNSNQQASNETDEVDGKFVNGVGSIASAATRYYNVNIHDGVDIHA